MNWNNPTLASLKTDVLTDLKARDVDAYTWAESPTNPPTGAKRWVSASNKIQEWNGSSWVDKVLSLDSGGTGSSNASGARTAIGLGTLATQNSNAISVSGGTISGLTSLGVSGNLTSTGILTMGSGPTTLTQSDGKVLETAIQDGTLLARNAGNESITGSWNFLNPVSFAKSGSNLVIFGDTAEAADSKYWGIYSNDNTLSFLTLNDSLAGLNSVLNFTRSGSTIASITLAAPTITLTGDVSVSGPILAPDGTAPSTVAYGFTSSPDTGFMLSGGSLQLRVDSTLGMTFDEVAGVVRIGVHGPFQNDLMPLGSAAYNLGASGQKWNEIHAQTVFTASGTVSVSDITHKRNHGEIENALDKLRRTETLIGSWIQGPDNIRFPALSAQNIKEVWDDELGTEIVKVDKFGVHAMYYERMIPCLVATMKELDAQVQSLRGSHA